jgi:copper(I)-binding protein
MKFHRTVFLLVLCAGLFSAGAALAQEPRHDIIVSQAWVRAMPPSMKNTAAYMTIENRTGQELVLQSASTGAARVVELHKMEQAGTIMNMKEVDTLGIPAGGSLVLKPHSFHLMMIDLVKPLVEGETIPIVLTFADGSQLTVNAVVRRSGEGS